MDNTASRYLGALLVEEKRLIPETSINECDFNGVRLLLLLFISCIALLHQKLFYIVKVLRARRL